MASLLKDFIEETETCTESSPDQVDCIGVVANLLEQLFAELQLLGIKDQEFALLMSDVAPDTRLRLDILYDTVRLLSIAKHPSSITQLTRRAKRLIAWLSAKLDELSLYALDDLSPDAALPATVH
jgi:hypothetical protein